MLSETRQQSREYSFDELLSRNITYFNRVYGGMNHEFSGSSKDKGLISKILNWDKEQLKQFYYACINKNLTTYVQRFGIDESRAELAFSLVTRMIRKKRIKLEQ